MLGSHADRLDLCKYRLRIITAAPSELFSLRRTLPWCNCIRPQKIVSGNEELRPTPFYNCTLRSETSMHFYSNLIHQTSRSVEDFQDALILFAIWLRQRGFGSAIADGGFGVYESSLLMAALLEDGGLRGRPMFQANYSRHQLFKALLSFLKTRDLIKDPLLLHCDLQISKSMNLLKAPILFDGNQGLNVLFKMSAWSYQRVRHCLLAWTIGRQLISLKLRQDASATLAQLNDATLDPFQDCFISRTGNPVLRYDHTLR